MKSRRGFSLPELLVYMAVLSVFMTGLYATFSLGINVFQKTQGKSDVVQASGISTNFIDRCLASGSGQSLQVQTSPPACKFLSAAVGQLHFRFDPATNSPIWQKWVCFYHDSQNNRLMMSEVTRTPLPTSNLTAALDTAVQPTFATLTNPSQSPARVVARNVRSVSFSRAGTLLSYSILTEVTPSIPNAKPTSLQVSGHFAMRN